MGALGHYPHADVNPQSGKSSRLPVQRGVWYSPDISFYAFDIKIHPEDEFLNYDEAHKLFADCDFFQTPPVVRGTFAACFAFDVETFITKVPLALGLPEIAGNFAEGIVLKPVFPARTAKRDRVILKKKHSNFSEIAHGAAAVPKKKKGAAARVPEDLPEPVMRLSAEIVRYINVNRFRSLISKLGRPKPGKVAFADFVAAYAKDVLDDFQKDHVTEFQSIEKPMQKKITGYMNVALLAFLRDHWENAVAGTL